MPTRNVVLTDHQEDLIARLGSGRYENASEVMRESLRLMEPREAEDAAKLDALRRRFEEAEAEVEAGDVVEFGDELLKRLDEDERAGR